MDILTTQIDKQNNVDFLYFERFFVLKEGEKHDS